MPKSRRYDHTIFEEPLIDISMQPTEEVDPLFIDPTAESIHDEFEDELTLNGFSIFSPKVATDKPKEKKTLKSVTDGATIKQEKDDEVVKVKEEPKDQDDELEEMKEEHEEIDPVDALAQALDEVKYLCPKCTFRSTNKEEVTQHFVSSHRVCQVGIPRPCDKCDFIAKTVRELASHKKQSHPRSTIVDNLPSLPTGEFKCPHCDFTSFHRNNVRSHLRVHTKDTIYTCDKCPYTAISRINIENHAARHLVKSRRKWKFKCKHCGLLERTEKLLQRHLILHGEGEMLRCQLCSYKSPYSHIISMHTRICHGIIGKKSWDREEKWKRKVRQSTRACTRERKSYREEKNEDIEKDNFKEELLELPPKKRSNRGRKKRTCDTTAKDADEVVENIKTEHETNEKVEDNAPETAQGATAEVLEKPKEAPRRPTLEERLGRARELINKNLGRKKIKNVGSKEDVKENTERSKQERKSTESDNATANDDNPSGTEEDNTSDEDTEHQSESDEDETGSKDDWSEDSDFDPDTAEDSVQSFASDKNNSVSKDNENSLTDSESLKRVESSQSGGSKNEPKISSDNNKNVKCKRNNKRKTDCDSEQMSSDNESTKSKHLKPNSAKSDDESNLNSESKQENFNESVANAENTNIASDMETDSSKESARAVLVLKRNGSSFTCIPKNNSDSS